MSHRDAVSRVPEGFSVTASTDVCPVAAMEDAERRIYTTQFHPEVKHTECGQQLLRNFLFEICGIEASWTMDNLVETMTEDFRAAVGEDRVILALSGGVDSSVVAALGARAVGRQMTCVFINHGLLRRGEPEQVEEVFTKQFDVDFVHVHAEARYAALLDGVTDPEQTRRIIGTQPHHRHAEPREARDPEERRRHRARGAGRLQRAPRRADRRSASSRPA